MRTTTISRCSTTMWNARGNARIFPKTELTPWIFSKAAARSSTAWQPGGFFPEENSRLEKIALEKNRTWAYEAVQCCALICPPRLLTDLYPRSLPLEDVTEGRPGIPSAEAQLNLLCAVE